MPADKAPGSEPATGPATGPFQTGRLPHDRPQPFALEPDAEARAALAAELDLTRLRKLRFAGALHPLDSGGWELRATLGATVVQPCRVTLDPVTTRIDEEVTRRYLPGWRDPALSAGPESELEMPDDPDTEALGSRIDPAAVMAEALALAVPAFPRAPGLEADAPTDAAAAADESPMHRPFAGLGALRDKLARDDKK